MGVCSSFPPCEDTQKYATYAHGLSPYAASAGALFLDLVGFSSRRNKALLFLNYTVKGVSCYCSLN